MSRCNNKYLNDIPSSERKGVRRQQEKPVPHYLREIRHYNIRDTKHHNTKWHYLTGTINVSTTLVWLWYKICFFRNTAMRSSVSITTDALGSRARTELVLPGEREGEDVRVRLVRFYENISWVMHVLCWVCRPTTASDLWLKCIGLHWYIYFIHIYIHES